jgi:hypothetical protein
VPLSDYPRCFTGSLSKLVVSALISAWSLGMTTDIAAQTLHAPTRTLFKCQERGAVVYSDSPCLGAEKLEVVPTRGVNKLSGKERIGRDVQRELHHEMFAEAVRPLTGLSARQLEIQSRRFYLPGAAQQECRSLDQNLASTELEEKRAAQNALRDVQTRLLSLRQCFRELRC